MLIGNLKDLFADRKWEEIFNELGINPKARAEDLSLEQWKQLCLSLE
jgi:16S rRNA A1518/A1519 N6-dimethyltransferase RsmA/KsgA/DIM1 with predicted DNA glycosylase/AP lyase activity